VNVDDAGNHRDHAHPGALRPDVLAVRFATELALLAGLAVAGLNAGGQTGE
jgi:hypothetical protein